MLIECSGGGGGERIFVSGNDSFSSASETKVIHTGLSEVKEFIMDGWQTNNTSRGLFSSWRTDRTGNKQIGYFYSNTQGFIGIADKSASTYYNPAIVSISGGDVTVQAPTQSGFASITFDWYAR